jgi:3D (Asp-Asp-Asp) domain-containing protein
VRKSIGWPVFVLIMIGLWVKSTQAAPKTYYVAPTGGSDSNSGTDIGTPFATISHAISTAVAGDTIYLRGGTFNLSANISTGSSKVGTAANPFNLFAYPGETPILDFRGEAYSANNSGAKGITVSGSYWHVKGLTIQYAADNGVNVSGSNNTIEQVVSRQNQDSGFIISGTQPSNNVFLNDDSYGNFDYGMLGENADGFAIKFRGLGPGNKIIGARSFDNADDGYDFWQAENGVTVINSWSFHNGKAAVFNIPAGFNGDGNGIKLGKDSGQHVLENMLVWGNPANGVDVNGNATQKDTTPVVPAVIPHGVQIYNVTATGNGGKNFNFDEDPTTATPPTTHVLRNNVSYTGSVAMNSGNTVDHNTFAGPGGSPTGLGASAADFVSTVDPLITEGSYHPAGTGGDRSGTTTPVYATGPAVGPRKADGSLPDIDFMRLATGSHLIDAGVDVGLPFNATAPDLGYFESVPVVVNPPLAGDYNGDHVVDAADYTVWRDTFGSTTDPRANGDDTGTSAGVIDQADYIVWMNNFGMTSPGSGAGAGAAAVPEPATWLLLMLAGMPFVIRRIQCASSR